MKEQKIHNAMDYVRSIYGTTNLCSTVVVKDEQSIFYLMDAYSDQQNAELREQNRKNQSRWAKDRVEQDKKHESAMMEACGQIVDLEERVKELEVALQDLVDWQNKEVKKRISFSDTMANARRLLK